MSHFEVQIEFRFVGRLKIWGYHFVLGLTDLSKSGVAMAPPAPTGLEFWHSEKECRIKLHELHDLYRIERFSENHLFVSAIIDQI